MLTWRGNIPTDSVEWAVGLPHHRKKEKIDQSKTTFSYFKTKMGRGTPEL